MGKSSSTISGPGCLVAAIAKLIIQCGLRDESSFNIGTLATWLNNNSGYSGTSASLYWAKPANMISGFSYYGALLDASKGERNSADYQQEILNWISQGYHMVICVKTSSGGRHWVAVDEERSLKNNCVYIMNCGTNTSKNANITLNSVYPTFYGIHAYKGGTTPGSSTTYTITYNANGGSNPPSAQTKQFGTPLVLTTAKPSRSGYIFAGWAESSSATSVAYLPGDSFTKNANTTLYAVWRAGDGSSDPFANTSSAAQIKSKIEEAMTKSEFSGATYTSFDNMGRGSGSHAFVYSMALELFNVGIPNEVVNSYGYATTLASSSDWMQVGATATSTSSMIALLKTARAGDIFQFGHKNAKNHIVVVREVTSTGIKLLDTTSSKNLRQRNYTSWSDAEVICDFSSSGSGLSLYRCTKPLKGYALTISYDANGGSGAPLAQIKASGTTLTLSSIEPQRTGFIFLGWAESSSATTAAYQPRGSFTKNANTTLYAVWGEKPKVSGVSVCTVGDPITFTITGSMVNYSLRVMKYSVSDAIYSTSGTTERTFSFTPTEPGEYYINGTITVVDGRVYILYLGTDFSVVAAPVGLSVSTDKSTYLTGETVTITPSASNAAYYAVTVWDGGAYGAGNCVYQNPDFSDSISFTLEHEGTYSIRCEAYNSAGSFITTDSDIRVVSAPTLSIRYSSKTITIGTPFQFSATGGSGGYTWRTGNSSVATVDSTGKVTGKSVGNTYLYCKDSAGSEVRCYMEVREPLSIRYSSKTITIGTPFQFTATGGSGGYTWRIGNTATATVTSSGKVTGVAAGNTYLYCQDSFGTEVKCLLKVVDEPLSIRYAAKTITIGTPFQFSATGGSGGYTWRTGNSSVATVDSSGKVTGKSVGNTYLYCKDSAGSEVRCYLEVREPLSIRYAEKIVTVGVPFQFSATGGSGGYTWRTGNSSVATVDSSGKVMGKATWNTYLYCKDSSGTEVKCLLKVIAPLSIRYAEKTVGVGSTFQFSATGGSGTYTWRTGNSSVATVDSTGKVTGKSVGNTYLYCRDSYGNEVRCLLKIK